MTSRRDVVRTPFQDRAAVTATRGAPEKVPLSDGSLRVGMALYGDLTFDSRVRKEARTLAEAGYDVTIACLAAGSSRADLPSRVEVVVRQPPARAVIPGAPNPFSSAHLSQARKLRSRAAWLASYIRGLRAWGRLAVDEVGRVDVWHVHDLTGLAAIAPNISPPIPIIYDSHELFLASGTPARLPLPLRRLLQAYERHLVSRTSAVITVNEEIEGVLRRQYRPKSTVVIRNCPDRWEPPSERPSLIRDATAIPPGVPIVLYHGALTANRGVEQLMAALLVDDLQDVHLVLMGYGERRAELEGVANASRARLRVHFLDPVAPSMLLSWVSSADVGAMPNPGRTSNDVFSSPNKLFECLAAGTPVVVSDFPTMRRIVIDNPGGPLGQVCDPLSVESVAAAIRSVVRLAPAEMAALRARCLRAAAERWNWENEAGALLRLYSNVVPRPD